MDLLQHKKILFLGGANQRLDLMVELSKLLSQTSQITPFYFAPLPGDLQLYKEKGIKDDQVLTIPSFNFHAFKDRPIDWEYLRNAEEKYGFSIWSSWQISAPRKKSRLLLKDTDVLPLFEYLIRKVESFFESEKPDYLISIGLVASIHLEILCRIAQFHSCEMLQITNARVKGRITIDSTFTDRWPGLVVEYQRIKKKGLSSKEHKEVTEFIEYFRKNTPRPNSPIQKIPESFYQKVIRFSGYPRMLWLRKSLPDWKPMFIWPFTDPLLTRSSLFEDPVPGEKFVFFPLHYQPEASTSLWGKWHVNQPTLIEQISKSLPVGYKLYVKEHRHGASGRPNGFFKAIKGLPNVRLIRPTANTFELIKQSSLVTTITGTVGWEAILFQKPVITFGDIFYNEFEGTIKLRDMSTLPTLIRKHLDSSYSYEEVFKFVAAVLASSTEGSAVCPGECKGKSLEEENLAKILSCINLHLQLTREKDGSKIKN